MLVAGGRRTDSRRRLRAIATKASGGPHHHAAAAPAFPELLAALDAIARAAGWRVVHGGSARAAPESQIFAIVAQRLRARLGRPVSRSETAALVEAVAAHRLDPYSAADRLLDRAERAKLGSAGPSAPAAEPLRDALNGTFMPLGRSVHMSGLLRSRSSEVPSDVHSNRLSRSLAIASSAILVVAGGAFAPRQDLRRCARRHRLVRRQVA